MMKHATQRMRSARRVVVSALLLSAPVLALAQAAPARETPRPQDVDPAVNTSAAAPANEDAGASSSTSGGAAGSAASARTTGNGAAKSATSKAGSTGASGTSTAPNSAATSSSPNMSAPNAAASTSGTTNPSSAKATANAKPALGPDGKPVKGKALDRLELDTTQITGNRELPKVLYIVPWKRSDLGDLTGKPVNSLVDEVLTPVDRDVFKRENRYYRALENAPANGTTAPSSGTSPASATDSGSANPAARDER